MRLGRFATNILVVFILVSTLACACIRDRVPTRAPVPTTPEEQEYVEWFDDISNRVSESIDMLEESLESYARDSSDLNAGVVMAREMVKLSSIYYEEAAEKVPPQSLTSVHEGLLKTLGGYKSAVDALEDGAAEKFLIYVLAGKEQFFECGKLYRQWQSDHF